MRPLLALYKVTDVCLPFMIVNNASQSFSNLTTRSSSFVE